MRWQFAGILLFLLIICLAGCAQPVGNLGRGGITDTMWVIPRRIVYDMEDYFWRTTVTGKRTIEGEEVEVITQMPDFQLFIVDQGEVTERPDLVADRTKLRIDVVFNISISSDGNIQGEEIWSNIGNYQMFYRLGRHRIRLTLLEASGYSGETEYSIQVFSSNNGSGGLSGDGVQIIWDGDSYESPLF
jgi:hypothetical protein